MPEHARGIVYWRQTTCLSCHQAPGKLRRPDGDVELPNGETGSEKLPDGLPRRPDGDVELSAGMRDFLVPPCVLLCR
jgi:hypothetical protein